MLTAGMLIRLVGMDMPPLLRGRAAEVCEDERDGKVAVRLMAWPDYAEVRVPTLRCEVLTPDAEARVRYGGNPNVITRHAILREPFDGLADSLSRLESTMAFYGGRGLPMNEAVLCTTAEELLTLLGPETSVYPADVRTEIRLAWADLLHAAHAYEMAENVIGAA